MDVYFVTGQPRSRTAWVANFLTYGGSFCHFELLNKLSKISALREVFESLPFKRQGVSDSGFGWMWESALKEFPGAKVLRILRPWKEASASYHVYFSKFPFPGIETPSLPMLEILCMSLEQRLDRMSRALPAGQYKEVRYDDLHKEEVCRDVWSWLVPGEPFNSQRWAMLDGMRVNMIPTKFSVRPENFMKLVDV